MTSRYLNIFHTHVYICIGVDNIDINALNQERATAIEKKDKEDEENENEEMTDFGDEDEDEEGSEGSSEYQSIDGDDDSRE
jgi:hypothetical protein